MKILMFTINGNHFGIDIEFVHEAINYQKITPMVNAGPNVVGMTEVRGSIYTCVDLHGILFENGNAEKKNQIFLLMNYDDKNVAFIVDSAEQVVDVNEDDIDTSALPMISEETRTISGILKYGKDLISILNVDSLVDTYI